MVSVADADNPALSDLREFTGKVVLVASSDDEVVPAAITDAYEAAAGDVEARKLNGAGHRLDDESHHDFRAMVLGWAVRL